MLADLSARPRTMPESHEVVEDDEEEQEGEEEEEEEDTETGGTEDGDEEESERFMSNTTDPNTNHCRLQFKTFFIQSTALDNGGQGIAEDKKMEKVRKLEEMEDGFVQIGSDRHEKNEKEGLELLCSPPNGDVKQLIANAIRSAWQFSWCSFFSNILYLYKYIIPFSSTYCV